MRIYISEPRGVLPCAASAALLDHWGRALLEVPDAEFRIHMAQPHEIHGDRLTRLWQEIYSLERGGGGPSDHIYLISENDFIVEPEFLKTMAAWPWQARLILPLYCTRGPRLEMLEHHDPQTKLHLTAPWFIMLNLSDRVLPNHWPPLNWLGPAGPFNDAANFALVLGDDSFIDAEIDFLTAYDCGPDFMGVRYEYEKQCVGTHCFFARELASHPDTILLPQAPHYTAGRHAAQILELCKK